MSTPSLYLRIRDRLTRAWSYWPWPMNGRDRPVTAFVANVLFEQARPGSESELLPATPGGSIVPTYQQSGGLQDTTNQELETTDYLITTGYTQRQFPRVVSPARLAAINPAELDYYNEGKVNVERVESITWEDAARLLAPFTRLFLEHIQTDEQARILFCELAATCGLSPSANTFSVRHWQTSPKVIQASYRGSMEFNDCDSIGGWFANINDPNTPQVVSITVDGALFKQITVSIGNRQDVQDALKAEGVNGVTTTVFGWRFDKPGTYRDGRAHKWAIVGEVAGAPLAVNYLTAQTISCAAPVDPTTPYPVQQLIQVASSLTKGGVAIVARITERLSNGSSRPYAGPAVPVWSIKDNPTGFTLAPDNAAFTLSLLATSAVSVGSIELQAGIGSGTALPATIQVISPECQRETKLTTYGYAYNVIDPNTGYARLFDTLDDANNTAGALFDGSLAGSFGTLYQFQAATLTVGATVYIVNGTNNCEKVSDGIIYVLDSSYDNTVLKAVQVSGGKIIAIKASTYTSPGFSVCSPHENLTQPQFDEMPFIYLYERASSSVYPRSFVSRAEVLQYIQNTNERNFDRFKCSTTNLAVGDILYNGGNTHNPDDPNSYLLPCEAGFWGYQLTMPTSQATGSVTVIQTNACGDIISRETVTLLLA